MSELPPDLPDQETVTPTDSISLVGAVKARLYERAADLRQRYHTRPVTTFISKGGDKLTAAADQTDIDDRDPANVKVWLKTHDKEIVMTLGGLLVAIEAIRLQRNRSQRRKMSNRASSYRRPPRK